MNSITSEQVEVRPRAFKNKRIATTRNISEYLVSPSNPTKPKPSTVAPKAEHANKGIRKDKKPTTLKKDILKAWTISSEDPPSSPLLEKSELGKQIYFFLKSVKSRQDALWKQNENKARANRTIVCGMHETLKHLKAGNVKCVFVARNIETVVATGAASYLFNELRSLCLAANIPLIEASTKKELSRAVNKFPYTNVVGLMRCRGMEAELSNITREWLTNPAHISYHIDQNSLFA